MAGRSRITSRPPFSCFKRSTTLRLRTSSQVISTAGLFSGMHGLLAPPRKRDGPVASRAPERAQRSNSADCQVRRGGCERQSRSHPPATGAKHLGGKSEGGTVAPRIHL